MVRLLGNLLRFSCVDATTDRYTSWYGPAGRNSLVLQSPDLQLFSGPPPYWARLIPLNLVHEANAYVAACQRGRCFVTRLMGVFAGLEVDRAYLLRSDAERLAEKFRKSGCLCGVGSGVSAYELGRIEMMYEIVHRYTNRRGEFLTLDQRNRVLAYIFACAERAICMISSAKLIAPPRSGILEETLKKPYTLPCVPVAGRQ